MSDAAPITSHAPAHAADPAVPDPGVAKHFDPVVDDAVDSGRVVGAAVLVARRGVVVYERYAGWADREHQVRPSADTLFRLASMTKPLVSVAALALVEQGRLTLDTPAHEVLPYFRPALPDGRTPDLTLRHLLTHTAGLGYGFLQPDNQPYADAGISDGADVSTSTLADNLRRLAGVPLFFEPGTAWSYSLATDVVGAMVEALTGEPLPAVVARLVTGPLGMRDTVFHAADPARLPAAYADADEPGQPARRMGAADEVPLPYAGVIRYAPDRVTDPDAYPSAGMGMVGTARDYLRFLEAVRLGGAPVLSPATTGLMTTDAVEGHPLDIAPGYGFGLGFSVVRDRAEAGDARPVGSYGWSGVYGTHCYVDPTAEVSVVSLTNTALEGMIGGFANEVEQALYRVDW
ncbi:serine hydrolase domain-containing protein [Polymorphospora rubra]|uniref:serine hydrolase domain-containing protein n=1 Tax=Polymorphospora rubra TaxID=338584 RepID=UPI0033DB763C